jgi:hypothetical protein
MNLTNEALARYKRTPVGMDPRGNLAGCKAHTRPGNRPGEPDIRLEPCTKSCWIMVDTAAAPQPITRLLIGLGKADAAALKRATPAALEKVYGVRRDWCAEYLRMERQQKGVRT